MGETGEVVKPRHRTFAMVKPVLPQYRLGDVIGFIENVFDIEEMRLRRLSPREVDEFYQEHVGKHFYEAMRTYMCSGPVVGMILARDELRRVRRAA